VCAALQTRAAGACAYQWRRFRVGRLSGRSAAMLFKNYRKKTGSCEKHTSKSCAPTRRCACNSSHCLKTSSDTSARSRSVRGPSPSMAAESDQHAVETERHGTGASFQYMARKYAAGTISGSCGRSNPQDTQLGARAPFMQRTHRTAGVFAARARDEAWRSTRCMARRGCGTAVGATGYARSTAVGRFIRPAPVIQRTGRAARCGARRA
jgi:hypothetical protein